MTIFDKYLESIWLSGDSNPLWCSAYRLDGTYPKPDLRRDASVGSCNCCDYFFFSCSGNLVLVEDTRLRTDIERKQSDFKYLERNVRARHIEKLICDENVLKVYGSLFVLYRFLKRCAPADMDFDIDAIEFWLVVNDDQHDEAYALDEVRSLLRDKLMAKLGKTIVSDVDVMTRSYFVQKYESETK